MDKNGKITKKSILTDVHNDFVRNSQLAPRTIKSYGRSTNDLSTFMVNQGIEPIVENVTYDLCKEWTAKLHEKYSPKTIKQRKSSMSSMFSDLIHKEVISSNPFLAIKVKDYTDKRHSDKLDLNEFFEVYKASKELEENGIPVLIPIHLGLFSAFRNSSLCRLTIGAVSIKQEGISLLFPKEDIGVSDASISKEQVNKAPELRYPNSKNKEVFVPLPPNVLLTLQKYIEGKDLDESLL